MSDSPALALVSESAVRQLLTRQLAYEAVQAAFESVASGDGSVFDVAVAQGLHPEESFALKAGNERAAGLVGFKAGSYWPENVARGLPAHAATTLLLDAATGFPRVLVNATLLNGYRTAAANAVATAHLARAEAQVLGVVGAGHQAEHEIRALREVRPLTLVKVATRSQQRRDWLAERLADLDCELRFTSIEQAVRDSDLVTTVTPARATLVEAQWVAPGTHISAMGADGPGKRELATELVAAANRFADEPAQSVRIGEFAAACEEGLIAGPESITPIGRVTRDPDSGRKTDEEITIFDSSGLAVQDIVIAERVYRAALQRGLVTSVAW